MEKIELKLLLEKIYEMYCSDVENLKDSDDGMEKEMYELMSRFVKFRLSVSGGSEYSMGEISMISVDSLIREIVLYNDMMDDGFGEYRGILSYECLCGLRKVLDELNVDSELRNEIEKKFKEYYEMDDDE